MSISGGIINIGATLSQTGGTAKTLSSDFQAIPNGIHVVDNSQSDFRIRPNATFRIKPPTLQPDGSWSKMKHSFTYVEPALDAVTGKITFNLVRVEREVQPDLSAASQVNLLTTGCQLCIKSPFTLFWANNEL